MTHFIYPVRQDQGDVMTKIKSSILEHKTFLLDAPCGYGKTPVILSAILDSGKKAVVFTNNHAARETVYAETLRMNGHHRSELVVIGLKAKKVMCKELDRERFSPEKCRELKEKETEGCDHYHKTCDFKSGETRLTTEARMLINTFIKEMRDNPESFFKENDLSKESVFPDKIEARCDDNGLCPYEIMKRMMTKANVIALDYHWLTSGAFSVLKSVLRHENGLKDYVCLIDEADAFYQRIQGEPTTKISTEQVIRLENQIKEKNINITPKDVDINSGVISSIEEISQNNPHRKEISSRLITKIFALNTGMTIEELYLHYSDIEQEVQDEDDPTAHGKPSLFFECLKKVDSETENHFISAEITPKRKIGIIKIMTLDRINSVLDNGLTLQECFNDFNSVILCSGTMGDPTFFGKELLGLKENSITSHRVKEIRQEKYDVIIHNGISSMYYDRENSTKRYAKIIRNAYHSSKSVLACFVSNKMKEDTTRILTELGVPHQELDKSTSTDGEGVFTLTISGKASRGVNKGKKIKNNIILGLQAKNPHDEYTSKRTKYLLKKHNYDTELVNQILCSHYIMEACQAAGRTFRDKDHECVLVFCDKRYYFDSHVGAFNFNSIPEYYRKKVRIVNSDEELDNEINKFWNGGDKIGV